MQWAEVVIVTLESGSLWNWTHIRKSRPRSNPHFSINGPGIFFEPGRVTRSAETSVLAGTLSAQRPGTRQLAGSSPGERPEAFEVAAGCSARLCPTGTSTAPRPAHSSQQNGAATPPPSQTQGALQPSGSDPLRVPVTRRNVTKS